MTVQEVAQYLRMRPLAVYRKVKRKEIPFLKAGRSIRFRKDEIDEWLQTGHPSPKEMERMYLARKRERIERKRQAQERKKLSNRISALIRYSLKGNKNGSHWENLVGYSLEALKHRLKKTIPIGFIWNDYLEGHLEIDHIIPITAFNIIDSDCLDFKRCWALFNLRLLPKKENISKGNRLTKPFQPNLALRG